MISDVFFDRMKNILKDDYADFEKALSKGEVNIREEKFTVENEEQNENTEVQEEQSEPNVQ